MNRRQFLKAATITTLHTAASPFTALAQGPFPFPLIEIKDSPALSVRAGLSAFGGINRFVQRGQKVLICPIMRYLPHVTGHGRNTHPDIVGELIQQSLNAGANKVHVMDSPFANPERCAKESGLRAVCDSFDPNMLIWPSRQSDYAYLPLPGTAQGGVYVSKVALEADTIILAPTALSGVSVSEPLFVWHMLVGLAWKDHVASSSRPALATLPSSLSLSLKLTVLDYS